MPRALWKGAISFGLIYVPVELHTASKENTLPLHMLDSRDFAPVGYHRVNRRTEKEVDSSHIVKGYEYKKGQFVALADADFKRANVKASETIEIDTFCDVARIPTMYYEKPYYLSPAKGGDKVYALLRQALEATNKVAVATSLPATNGRRHKLSISWLRLKRASTNRGVGATPRPHASRARARARLSSQGLRRARSLDNWLLEPCAVFLRDGAK
jgi:Ku protein